MLEPHFVKCGWINMKAIMLAKKLYSKLSKEYFINWNCPHDFQTCNKIKCDITKIAVINCVNCWDRDIAKETVELLLEAKKMCNLMCL